VEICEAVPICYVQSIDLSSLKGDPVTVATKLRLENECDKFVPWIQGLSPREHNDHIEQAAQRTNERRWKLLELSVTVFLVVVVSTVAQIVAALVERNSLFRDTSIVEQQDQIDALEHQVEEIQKSISVTPQDQSGQPTELRGLVRKSD
jgi:hypothetical protein